MKNKHIFLLLFPALLSIMSCGEKKKSRDIITRKPVAAKPAKPQAMGNYKIERSVEWVGSTYKIEITFKADPSLNEVTEGNQKYYDNRITLRVLRKDGTEFFGKEFTKSDFESCLDNRYGRNGALTGIVFVNADDDHLVFAASVGSPDKSSDEYIPLVLKLSRFGEISVSKDTQMDTNSGQTQAEYIEDGV